MQLRADAKVDFSDNFVPAAIDNINVPGFLITNIDFICCRIHSRRRYPSITFNLRVNFFLAGINDYRTFKKVILRHCCLCQELASRPPPDTDGLAREMDFDFSVTKSDFSSPDQAEELTYVDIDSFLATF